MCKWHLTRSQADGSDDLDRAKKLTGRYKSNRSQRLDFLAHRKLRPASPLISIDGEPEASWMSYLKQQLELLRSALMINAVDGETVGGSQTC